MLSIVYAMPNLLLSCAIEKVDYLGGIIGVAMNSDQKFEQTLRASLPEGFELPNEIWQLIGWLEGREQTFQYTNSERLFLPTMPVSSIDHVWSDLAFVIEPDMIRYWFGKDGLEEQIVPFVKCAADGSHLAAWKNGANYMFVFLGSEGEAFTITDNVVDFMVLITMGYLGLHGREDLTLTPLQNYTEYCGEAWPEPVEIKQYIQSKYGVDYPKTGDPLVKKYVDDPFVKFVEDNVS